MLRGIVIAAAGYRTRVEKLDGRDHLVLPVVGLVEGVVHAMNARQPEFVPAEEFSRAPHAWNGRPLFYGHPTLHGRPISGNAPDVLERACVGKVFGANVKNKKLALEAWLDVEAARAKAPELLARAEAAEPFEVSVGVFVSTDDRSGEHMGKKWLGAWSELQPDHLAILPPGQPGACSREMGCGVRAASQGEDLNAWSEETGVLRAAWPDKEGNDDHGRAAKDHEKAALANDKASAMHADAAKAHQSGADPAKAGALTDKAYRETDNAQHATMKAYEGPGGAKSFAGGPTSHYDKADLASTNAMQFKNDNYPSKDVAHEHAQASRSHAAQADYHRVQAKKFRSAADGSEVRAAYSDDQERDEKGRFSAGASSHQGAAALHHDAKAAHEKAYGGSGADKTAARDASRRAEAGTKEANGKSGKLPIGKHGTAAEQHAANAREHARLQNHDAAAKAHAHAAGSHEKLAELIRKAGELHQKLRNAEEVDDVKIEDKNLATGDKDASAFARFMATVKEKLGLMPDDVTPEAEDELRAAWPNKDGFDDHGRDIAGLAQKEAADAHASGMITGSNAGFGQRDSNYETRAKADTAHKQAVTQLMKSGYSVAKNEDKSFTGIQQSQSHTTHLEHANGHSAEVTTTSTGPIAYYGKGGRVKQGANHTVDVQVMHRGPRRNLEAGDPAEPTAAGAPCGCKHDAPTTEEESEMTREQIMEAMKTASPEQLKALSAALGEKQEPAPKAQPTEAEIKAAADAKAAQDKIDADKRAAEIKAAVDAGISALTFDQVMAKATPDVRAAVDAGQKAAKARKDASIKALVDLKRGGFTAETLASKGQDELDQLVALAGAEAPAIDYSLGGAPRANLGASEKTDAPAPPDVNERIRAARAKK